MQPITTTIGALHVLLVKRAGSDNAGLYQSLCNRGGRLTPWQRREISRATARGRRMPAAQDDLINTPIDTFQGVAAC
jgi:hypothetical protein